MTELEPTEIELTSREKRATPHTRRRIVAVIVVIALAIAVVCLTVILAHSASKRPEIIQPQAVPTEEVVPVPLQSDPPLKP